ncbi:MAG TPA: IS30 family transposase [Acidimicrobiia bacterium]|nr:IS30 family transposase [Acidimicrobiia bacterium]
MARFSEAERTLIWDWWQRGGSMRGAAGELGRAHASVRTMIESYGGVRPSRRCRAPRHLSLEEREEISRGLASGESLRSIAVRLGRSASTVSREVARNGGRSKYRALRADRVAYRRARRPKVCKLAANPALALMVEEKIGLWWSPQQISGWLKESYPDFPEMWVSHETIYLSLFVQGRGALKHELTQCLRTRRAIRRPTKKRAPTGKGQIRHPVMISERPAEADDRAVPGHWEGDLLMGRRMTAIGTLVERWSRYVMLFRLPDGNSAESVRTGLADVIQRLPDHLWQSLTWDQGKEMAEHAQFTIDTGIQIYFCDPKSPWQRGSNENTNGLLRQYFPKTTDMAALTQAELDEAAYSLNSRPRQTLGWMTPSQKLAEALR